MPPPQYSVEDSELILDLVELSEKSPKLCRSSVYPAPAEPNTLVRSWKLNEFKYYDIPSPFPTLARGLFTTELEPGTITDEGNPVKHRIVARGYDKFFNIGEVPWTTWEALEAHTAPPYTLSLKSNGCIIFIAALTPKKLLITSKHSLGPVAGVPTSHAQAGEEWLRRYLEEKGRTEADLAKRLWDENWTAIAELCDDSFEEHVLAYPPERTGLHLHGLNVATKSFMTMPHQTVDSFAEEWGFIKTRTHIVNSIKEVKEFTDHVSSVGEWEGEAVEGFVVRTHVTEPPTESRGASKHTSENKNGKSSYAPGSSFFFKVKFDEPYMMYRDWREVTKKLLSSKGPLSMSVLPKGKMKRKETRVYVKWVIGEIKKDRKAFDGYTKGHGIISTRERFLAWYKEQQEAVEAGGDGGKELSKLEAESEEELEIAVADEEGEVPVRAKAIIMPTAIPGSGKTSVAVALTHLFGFGHTQSDDIKAKKAAPIFIQNVTKLLNKNDVVFADKNNHLKQHRTQLHEVANKFTPRARIIAFNWYPSGIPPASLAKICSDRIVARGSNHQTLTPGASSHDKVLWMFINNFEELTSNEADIVIDMDVEDDLETMISCAVDGLFNTKLLTGPGGALDGVEKPDAGRIREVVRDVVGNYKVKKVADAKEVKKEEKRKGKPPRYYGLLPDLDLERVLEGVFGGVSADDEQGSIGKGKEFWEKLKKGNRVTEKPHITIVHQKSLPQDQDIWDKCEKLVGIPDSQPPTFECTIRRTLYDGRVMVLVIDDLQLDSSCISSTAKDETYDDDDAKARGLQAGTKFLKAIRGQTKDRLHITVGTANSGIQPVEGMKLVEKWRDGEGENDGVYEVEFEEKLVVEGKLAGLWT